MGDGSNTSTDFAGELQQNLHDARILIKKNLRCKFSGSIVLRTSLYHHGNFKAKKSHISHEPEAAHTARV